MSKIINFVLIGLAISTLCSCMEMSRYAIVTKEGIIAHNIAYMDECEQIIKKFKIDGLCITQ